MKHISSLLFAALLCATPMTLAALDPDTAQTLPILQPGAASQSQEQQEPQPPTESEATTQLQAQPSNEPAPVILPILSEPSDPSGFFFTAEQMRAQAKTAGLTPEKRQIAECMYMLAFRFAKEPAAQEAGKSLFNLLSDEGRLPEAIAIAREWIQSFGPDWSMYRKLYDALMAASSWPEALSLVTELSQALPSVAKSRYTELAWMEYNARSAMQDFSWTGNGLPFIKTKTPDTYVAKIFRLYAAAPNVPQPTVALALFRASATEKKYADAVAAALPILPTFTQPDTPRAWISELGKSFYGANAWEQGADFFSRALGIDMPVPSANKETPSIMPKVPDDTTGKTSAEPSQGGSNTTENATVTIDIETAFPPLDRTHISTEISWVMGFYLARMYQGMGDSQTAASIFMDLVPLAFSDADSDSALWYWLDITMNSIAETDELLGDLGQDEANSMHAKRALEISALSQAASLWKSPSYFEDIVGNYMRRLLREGAWDDVVRLCALMSQKLTSSMRGPLLYLSGRLIETERAHVDLSSDSEFWKWLSPYSQINPTSTVNALNKDQTDDTTSQSSSPDIGTIAQNDAQHSGLAPQAQTTAPMFYQLLLRENGIEEHYRTLAAWRLGIEPSLLANAPVFDKNFDIIGAISRLYPNADGAPVSDDKLKDLLDFIGQSLDYGLESLAANQVAALSPFSTDALMWLAMKFVQHEQYYPALRIGGEVLRRKNATSPELGYALLYPRAWPEHFGELTPSRNIAEPLAYAIVRSESMFNQRAVSRSGAMGLSQLLPGTAAETARGLKMEQYALFNPKDNLTIGLTYFGYMLQRFSGRPVRAIAAYNAGPSRMAQWVRDWGNLEDDILIELYPVAEPRQYTKNITAAALFYGKLYYDISAGDMLDFIYGVKPLPSPEKPESAITEGQEATTSSGTASSANQNVPNASLPGSSQPAVSSEASTSQATSAPSLPSAVSTSVPIQPGVSDQPQNFVP